MSDDRLFASNNPIGRKWYFINLIILSLISYGTYFFFTKQIIPNVNSQDYSTICNWILYILLFLYLITFFSLIERRLYDASGSRNKGIYKSVGPIFTLTGLMVLITAVLNAYPTITIAENKITFPIETLNMIAYIAAGIFLVLMIVIGLIKGKKTRE